ncbi:MAG: hypothetical protein M1827_005164 [Pycnora praestabilis]|nr:MAG: hypothetical protein M1827_005164 [Pycnora praestabilis]
MSTPRPNTASLPNPSRETPIEPLPTLPTPLITSLFQLTARLLPPTTQAPTNANILASVRATRTAYAHWQGIQEATRDYYVSVEKFKWRLNLLLDARTYDRILAAERLKLVNSPKGLSNATDADTDTDTDEGRSGEVRQMEARAKMTLLAENAKSRLNNEKDMKQLMLGVEKAAETRDKTCLWLSKCKQDFVERDMPVLAMLCRNLRVREKIGKAERAGGDDSGGDGASGTLMTFTQATQAQGQSPRSALKGRASALPASEIMDVDVSSSPSNPNSSSSTALSESDASPKSVRVGTTRISISSEQIRRAGPLMGRRAAELQISMVVGKGEGEKEEDDDEREVSGEDESEGTVEGDEGMDLGE